MRSNRTFTVKRVGLRDPEPIEQLIPQQALEQVEFLRRVHEELRGTHLGRIELIVQRRSLNG